LPLLAASPEPLIA
jgi:hypothetical protein